MGTRRPKPKDKQPGWLYTTASNAFFQAASITEESARELLEKMYERYPQLRKARIEI